MTTHTASRDMTRTVLGVLFIGLLLALTTWIMKPFLLSLVWASMITVSTWPLLLAAQRYLHNSRRLAAMCMTLSLLLVLIIPLVLAVSTIRQNINPAREWIRGVLEQGLPPLPDWIVNLPLVGEKVKAFWIEAASVGQEGLTSGLVSFAEKALAWFVSNASGMGLIVLNLLLTLVLTAILYMHGEAAASGITKFFRRLAGEQGEKAVILAGKATRAVAMGIVVTALAQSVLGGLGLWLAGVPAAALLTAVMFLLAIAQIGVAPVLLCSVGWLFFKGMTFWAGGLLVWSILVATLDNVLRPILIKKGADLPFLLIFAGVIGGLIAFGILGLFVGPVTLAVSYTLVSAWVEQSNGETLRGENPEG